MGNEKKDSRNATLFWWSLFAILAQIGFLTLNAIGKWNPSFAMTMISLGIIATYATQNRAVQWKKEGNDIRRKGGHVFAYVFWGYAILINILYHSDAIILGVKVKIPDYLIDTFWGVTGIFFGTELTRIFLSNKNNVREKKENRENNEGVK